MQAQSTWTPCAPGCPGWFVQPGADGSDLIQRCDECNRFADDEEAASHCIDLIASIGNSPALETVVSLAIKQRTPRRDFRVSWPPHPDDGPSHGKWIDYELGELSTDQLHDLIGQAISALPFSDRRSIDELVTAGKLDLSKPVKHYMGASLSGEGLTCPSCGSDRWDWHADAWVCAKCRHSLDDDDFTAASPGDEAASLEAQQERQADLEANQGPIGG